MLSFFYSWFTGFMYSKIIFFRNLYKYQTKKIVLVEKNNQIIKSNYMIWIFQLLSLFNLNFIINKLDYNYLYFTDDMYFYHTNNKKSNKIIFSVINNCYIKNDKLYYEITENILKYNLEVPMYMIIENENIQDNDQLEFNILQFGLKKNKVYSIDEIKNKKLCEII